MSSTTRSSSSSPYWMIKKPLSVVYQQENANSSDSDSSSGHSLQRHLTVWDLISVGVGGTIGSGIFVLVGQIASQYAGGPLTCVSFLLSGIAASLSGVCFAELSARLPAAGSTYVYAYVCLGEVFAVLAAACLTLEYAVAGAAVARSWGEKVLELMSMMNNNNNEDENTTTTSTMINLPAGLLSLFCTFLLLVGVQESKRVTNFFTVLKLLLVAFMIVTGLMLFDSKVFFQRPLAPYGMKGVVRGATSSFFGYLGYDEVCCLAGEAIEPAHSMPRAVLGTLLIVATCYGLSSIALAGMVSTHDISPTSGFPHAFESRGWETAAEITAIGEIVCLPVVVLISLLAQPRVAYSMARDGLLPSWFATTTTSTTTGIPNNSSAGGGNLTTGTLVCGLAMTVIATVIPFTYLNDLISAGILVSFSMANSCLVLLKCKNSTTTTTPHNTTTESAVRSVSQHAHQQDQQPPQYSLESVLAVFNAGCFVTALLWSHDFWLLAFQYTVWAPLTTLATIACFSYLARYYPKSSSSQFGDTSIGSTAVTTASVSHSSLATLAALSAQQKEVALQRSLKQSDSGTAAVIDATTTATDDANNHQQKDKYFETPCIPYLPCAGMAVNWYLIAQLEASGIFLLLLYLGVTVVWYLMGCAPHSIGQKSHWNTTPIIDMTTDINTNSSSSCKMAYNQQVQQQLQQNDLTHRWWQWRQQKQKGPEYELVGMNSKYGDSFPQKPPCNYDEDHNNGNDHHLSLAPLLQQNN